MPKSLDLSAGDRAGEAVTHKQPSFAVHGAGP